MNNSVNFPSGIFDKISIPNIKCSEENATKKPLNKEQDLINFIFIKSS